MRPNCYRESLSQNKASEQNGQCLDQGCHPSELEHLPSGEQGCGLIPCIKGGDARGERQKQGRVTVILLPLKDELLIYKENEAP